MLQKLLSSVSKGDDRKPLSEVSREELDLKMDDIRNSNIDKLKKEIEGKEVASIICETTKNNPNYYSIVASNSAFHDIFKISQFNLIGKSYDFLFQDIDIDYSSEDQIEYVRLVKSVKEFHFCVVNIAISNHDKESPSKIRCKITFSPNKDLQSDDYHYAILMFEDLGASQDHLDEKNLVNSSSKRSASTLLKNLERSLRKERLLREIGSLIISDAPIAEVAQLVAKILCTHLKADRCVIHDYQDSSTNFVEEFCADSKYSLVGNGDEAALKNIAQYINFQNHFFEKYGNKSGKSSIIAVDNIISDSNFDKIRDIFEGFNISSQIAVTTMFNDKINGGIYIHQSDMRSWTSDEVELVEMVADQFSIAIDRSESIERVMIANHALMERSSQLKEALKQEKEMRQMQNEFVAMVSHEFKTPLQIIDSTREVLGRKLNKLSGVDESINKSFDKIKFAIQRLNGLIQSTLNLAKMESGENKIKLERNIFDLKKFVADIIEKNADLADRKNIKLVVNLEGLPTEFNGDSRLLDHAFTNIISNAVKYSRDNSVVKVMSKSNEQKVLMKVVDQGIGIPKDDLKNIGQKFFRAKNTLEVAGTGIGIYLTKNFIELHKGSLKIDSELNVGTSLTVQLPIIK
ncbi:MAG: GAF domain-containing sensor histidine kinase [Rickettsiales bacterium]|nr:GAF domain-containing sensor histidine kinase [Rickettsiales bacterium]